MTTKEDEEGEVLVKACEKNNKLYLEYPDKENKVQEVGLIVCSTKETNTEDLIPYEVQQHDVIKFGRLSFIVRHMSAQDLEEKEEISCDSGKLANISGQVFQHFELHDKIKVLTHQEKVENEEEEAFCRYCWDETCSDKNPILQMCQCKGSSGAVHLECIRAYLHIKRNVYREGERVTSLFWKKFECEICRQGLPLSIEVNNEPMSLVNYEVPKTPHIILESQMHLGKVVT